MYVEVEDYGVGCYGQVDVGFCDIVNVGGYDFDLYFVVVQILQSFGDGFQGIVYVGFEDNVEGFDFVFVYVFKQVFKFGSLLMLQMLFVFVRLMEFGQFFGFFFVCDGEEFVIGVWCIVQVQDFDWNGWICFFCWFVSFVGYGMDFIEVRICNNYVILVQGVVLNQNCGY